MIDAIATAQDHLARTLARAQGEEDRELTKMVREQGASLATSLNGLLRMARTHALSNTAFDAPVQDFARRLGGLLDLLGPVHVICVEDQVYVNEVRVRFDILLETSIALPAEMRRHNAGGISFYEVLSEDHVRSLVRLFADSPAETSPRTTLQERLAAEGMSSVELQPTLHFRVSGEGEEEVSEEFHDVYMASAGVVAEAFASLGSSRLPNPLQARRIVTRFVDSATAEDTASAARELDGTIPAFSRHTLMVTNLAILIGRHVGLSKASLADLGVAAMFHDLGFSMTEDGYTVPFERHTRAGLRVLLGQRGFYAAKVRRLLTVIQHHRDFNDPLGQPSLFARIVHIADDYDILTRYRPGKGPLLAIPDAMSRMASEAGRSYDPDLLQAFINVMGPFPPGALLKLADGHIVVSVSGVRSPETFDKPLCRIIQRPGGVRPLEQTPLDLANAAKVVGILRPTS